MTYEKRARKQMLAHCQKINDDDGVDPREFFRTRTTYKKKDHKAAQLCSQVAETLSLILSGECDDEVLHNLQVVLVEPAPNASQLVVTVRVDLPGGDSLGSGLSVEAVLQRLSAIAGRLRCEVAAAITRKRAPRLIFQLVGPVGPQEVPG